MRFLTILVLAVCAATTAEAHSAAGVAASFAQGFVHPLGGLDHLLAMTGVGLFAWHLGGRALWALPLAFLATMATAAALAGLGLVLPAVELGIALSVVVFGALVAFGRTVPTALAAVLAAVFAAFHGHAHGAEIPSGATLSGYALGFLLATLALHGAGLFTGYLTARVNGARARAFARLGGAAISAAGVVLLGGAV
ncbi:HupE/UreJ family protein [Oceanibacterium hippocampi]|uniref:HupE / UreJ protein n=1 Tax=Oceanibacterium hippocampi TaxID=745714 RepID=A0A1Y5TZ86_9PROT|nr:HupE/UreJ family protein [Oceanibacterium hippocampi]SLN77403.1 HupE / UreJ protein [Oceanibacterium hippocampi]